MERGLAYAESGEVERAIQDYDAAIAIDPSYGSAHENKGAACLMLERWAEAVPHLDIALRLAPSQAVARYNRGLAHEMLDDLPRAVRDFQDSVRAAPTGMFAPHAEQRLRALQARAGDIPEPEWPAPESLWTQLVPLSLEDTVADLVQKAHAEGAFFGMVTLPDGVLRDVMARDAETLQRLGLGHAQIADALDRLLAEALRASEDRIARATDQFEEELQASGMRGVPGLAVCRATVIITVA